MDCAVEVDGSVVNVIIGARVGECTARFWSGRSLSNYRMARRRGCLWVEPLPCGLHVYAGEPREWYRSDRQTDRRTDDMLSQYRALHYSASVQQQQMYLTLSSGAMTTQTQCAIGG